MTRDAHAIATALLRRVLRDDVAAWDELVRTYSGFLLAVARKIFASYNAALTQQDLEDAVADVWKNLLENDRRVVRNCIERQNLPQTLQVLTRNRCVDIMRRRQGGTAQLHDQHAAPQESEPPVLSNDELAVAVKQLPDRERLLVTLFFLQGKKYRQIADLTGIPQNSIGPTLARALARLRKNIGEV